MKLNVLLTSFLLCGCSSQRNSIVQIDTTRILETAAQEIKANCPELRLVDFRPWSVNYRERVDSKSEGSIAIQYISNEPTRVADWKPSTNGTRRVAYKHKCATVLLSTKGKLKQQNIGEWEETPEWAYVNFSEMTTVKETESVQ